MVPEKWIIREKCLFSDKSPEIKAVPISYSGDYSKVRIYSNNSLSLGKLEHDIEQTLANIDPEKFRRVARNRLKKAMLVFEKVVDISSVYCKTVL
jgi:hypothetical protein